MIWAMGLLLSTTGDPGSAPGELAPRDFKKWIKTTLYLVGSVMAVAGLNALSDAIVNADLSDVQLDVFNTGLVVSGSQIGMVVVNLIGYALELIAKDSRR